MLKKCKKWKAFFDGMQREKNRKKCKNVYIYHIQNLNMSDIWLRPLGSAEQVQFKENKKAVQSQAEPRDAAVNLDTYRISQ